MKKKALVVFGTRPEAIKQAPIVKALEASSRLEPVTCATAQHRGMLDQVLSLFRIQPDYDLNLMQPNQDLFHITSACLTGMKTVIEKCRPSVVLVQGDTTTTMAAALAAFYCRVPVGHVEAGLRTGNKHAPYPEEINRRLVTSIADFHFAPTEEAARNLRAEGINPASVCVTGNTSIDALVWTAEQPFDGTHLEALYGDHRFILMTAHRRESFGEPLEKIFGAVREFAQRHPECHVVYAVHPNPNVKRPAEHWLAELENVSLIPPVSYAELVYLMKRCHLVLTDSGGLQEEAPTLGKPVLVLRETTERPEAVTAGCARLVGHDPGTILLHLNRLMEPGSHEYRVMAQAKNPYGDGTAAQRTVSFLEQRL